MNLWEMHHVGLLPDNAIVAAGMIVIILFIGTGLISTGMWIYELIIGKVQK